MRATVQGSGSWARPPGALLAAGIGILARLRGPRPIHTTGLLLSGRIRFRPPGTAVSGIAWIDERDGGEVAVTARLSRGAALPAALPDIIGLAVRMDDGAGDLLLSTTGMGVPGRFVLLVRWTPTRAFLGTLMPYRGSRGPVLVAARAPARRLPARFESIAAELAREPWRLELMFASATGRWHRFGELELSPMPAVIDGPEPRFDALLNAPRGAGTYAWTRALREPSYSLARRRSR